LKIRMVRSLVAAGNVGGFVGFTNRGSAPCRLTGWPTLVATRAGAAATARHVRSTMFGPSDTRVRTVTLRYGERADAVFAGSDIALSGETCPPPYRRLRVTPPGNSGSVVLSAWLRSLDAYLPSCSPIVVTMVVPASTLYKG
jgi:hypothetical protein